MSLSVQIVDPIHHPSWDEILLRTPGATFFHSSAWARVLSESYGYTPFYFTVMADGGLQALVPLLEVKSFLTGKRGVSLPFTDFCYPIFGGNIPFQEFFSRIIEFGHTRGWKYFELRGAHDLSPMTPCLTRYIAHTLDLTRGEKTLYSGLRDSTRRNIKKAEKEQVEVRIENTKQAMGEFCRLNRMTRRAHGLPPQPFHFFEKVHEHIISKERGFIALAYFQGKTITGNVYFHFGDRAIYKYGASDRSYQHLRANNLVMWEAVKWFAGKGFKSLSFGRTELENEGLRQFKAGWGAEESQVSYFKYDLRQGAFVPGKQKGEPAYANLFRATPAPILNAIGSLLYRHMG